MSVTSLHDALSDELLPPAAPSPRRRPHVPTIAVIVTDHAPDADALAHLVESYEIVLVTHDPEMAALLLRGLPGPGAADGGLALADARHLVGGGGRPLPLTARERAILTVLLEHHGRVMSYRALFESAWGTHYLGDPSLVHSALKRLRRKLREAGADLTIDAVRGVGFRAC